MDGTGNGNGNDEPFELGVLDLSEPRGRLRRRLAIAAALLVALGIGGGAGWAIADLTADEEEDRPPPAPTVVFEEAPEPEAASELGFPGFATRNTTRVGGVDPIADAVGVALASYPPFGDREDRAAAVVLAPADSWQAPLIAGSLAHSSIGAPLLLGEEDGMPELTADALEALSPTGLPDRGEEIEVIAIGDVAVPDELETLRIEGADEAELARAVARHRTRLSGIRHPDHLLVVPSRRPAIAMPAAAWAAHWGDPIIFADGDEVPEATLEVLERHPRATIYVLGPREAISARAVRRLARGDREVRRIADTTDPVESSIEFARFADGDFGFNIFDSGHGFIIANADRPADAGVAASLTEAGGKPGPLLLTDSATELPAALCNFLLDRKPGFRDDPTRAPFNHVWLIGDETAISIEVQTEIDNLAKLERIGRGEGDRCPPLDEPEDEEERDEGPEDETDEDEDQADDAAGVV